MRRAQASAFALMLLPAVPFAPSAAADSAAADCAVLREAAGDYAKLSSRLSNLRKTADRQQDDRDALIATQREVVEVSRALGRKLHELQFQLQSPLLSYAYKSDAISFDEYAATLEGAIDNGDISGGNIHVTTAYSRNEDAVAAANDAYHTKCK